MLIRRETYEQGTGKPIKVEEVEVPKAQPNWKAEWAKADTADKKLAVLGKMLNLE